jgi:hypothetical protein
LYVFLARVHVTHFHFEALRSSISSQLLLLFYLRSSNRAATLQVSMKVQNDQIGSVDLSGNMTKQSSSTHTLDDHTHTHMANMDKMIEDSELAIRNSIEGIYIQKTREVINGMRNPNGQESGKRVDIGSLKDAVTSHGSKRAVDSQ